MQYEIAVQVYRGIYWFVRVLQIALLAYCVLSWISRPNTRLYIFLRTLVSPLLAPFRPLGRKLMEWGLMIDVTPFLAMLALQLIQRYLPQLIFRLVGLF